MKSEPSKNLDSATLHRGYLLGCSMRNTVENLYGETPAYNHKLENKPKDKIMTELEKIFITSAATIIGGLFVYIAGQLLSKFFIEPIHELKKTLGDARFNLAFHASVIHTPISRNSEESQKAYEALMKSSCDLLARANSIPFYSHLSGISLGFLPSKPTIVDSAIQLRALSTYVQDTSPRANDSIETIAKLVARIEKNLGFEPLE